MSVTWGKTHSAYVERNAVNPRNYDANAHTSEDSHKQYTQLAMKCGKTVGDLLIECLHERKKRELLGF